MTGMAGFNKQEYEKAYNKVLFVQENMSQGCKQHIIY